MAFTGFDTPDLQVLGDITPQVRSFALTLNAELVNALQQVPDEDLAWADMAHVTKASFRGVVPLDFTAIDGFEAFTGDLHFKQVDIAALQVDVAPWRRNLEWPLTLDGAPEEIRSLYDLPAKAAAVVMHARVHKARMVASVLMQGTPSVNKAKVYAGNSIPGAGLSLFNTTHLANPLDAKSRTFSNYHAAAGAFDTTALATTRVNMRKVPSPVLSAETMGLQVTDIVGPSHMEEVFRQVQLQMLTFQATSQGAAAVSNIYAGGMTPWRYWIAPQLDGDPYVTANPGKHMWIAVSRKLPGVSGVELVGPSTTFTPTMQLFTQGSEMAAVSGKTRLITKLDAGAAAGLPHVVARYEET